MTYFPKLRMPTTQEALVEYLHSELREIALELQVPRFPGVYLEYRATEPEKVEQGLVVLADGVNWDPGEGVGPYYHDGVDWVFIGGGAAVAGSGYVHVEDVDLTSLPALEPWIFRALDPTKDYEYDFLNIRSVTRDAFLSFQLSDGTLDPLGYQGLVWADSNNDYGFQRIGANSTLFSAKVAWESNTGRGLIGDEQDNDYVDDRPPGNCRVYIDGHDLADGQTIARGTYTSYGSVGRPFIQAMFTTRLLEMRVDKYIRFMMIEQSGNEEAWKQGVCRIYERQRV